MATVGLKMNVMALVDAPLFFPIGGIWMAFHAVVTIAMTPSIKAPSSFLAVGSEANTGGAASAPARAAGFHPSLIPVGALLVVLGYIIGTFGG